MRLIVVGSGIVGAACAYAASGLGAQVTVVDAAEPGRATAAGAGIICPWTASVEDPGWYEFACAAARHYPPLIAALAELGEDEVSYRQVGALLLAGPDQDAALEQAALERAMRRLDDRRAAAPEIGDVRVVTGAEAQELFPPLHPGRAAVHISGAARVDGRRLAAALIRAATRQGATTRTGTARLVCREAGEGHGVGVTGVTVDGDLIEADAVVAAAGAWTAQLLEPAGITVRVVPQRGQIAHIGLGPADTSRWPVVLPSATGHYLLAFDDSRVVAGATRETGAGFDPRVTAAGLAEVLDNALAVAPGLGAGTLLETRVGLRPAGPDARPLLGLAGDGLVVATGLGASGLTLGPYAGAIAARAALGLPQDVDLAPFDPLR
jgi:D-amino-acid dehydrogenase